LLPVIITSLGVSHLIRHDPRNNLLRFGGKYGLRYYVFLINYW